MIVELLIITALALVIGGLIGYKLGFKYALWQMEDNNISFKDFLFSRECTAVHPCPKCKDAEKVGYAKYQYEMDQYAEDIEAQSAMHDAITAYDIDKEIEEYDELSSINDMHDEHGNRIEG